MVEAGERMRDAIADSLRMDAHMGQGRRMQADEDKDGSADATAHHVKHAIPQGRTGA